MRRPSSSPSIAITLVCLGLCGPTGLLGSDGATPASASNPFENWYGRAGGPVGADAVGAVVKGATPAPSSAQVQWFGRAGTLAGTEVAGAQPHTATSASALPRNAFDNWYGRAGGPLGISSPAAQDHPSATADAGKRDYVWEVYGPSVRSVATGDCVRVGSWVPEAGARECQPQSQVAQRPPASDANTQSPPAPSPPQPVRTSQAPTVRALPPQPEVSTPAPAPPTQALAQEPSPADTAPATPLSPATPTEHVVEAPGLQPETPLHLTLDAQTHFNFNKYELKPTGQAKVAQLLAELGQMHYDNVIVTGHTDRIGSKAYNEALSERRALTVKRYLAKKGLDAKKIQARGVGAAEPVTSADACEGLGRSKTIECLAPDRRVEVVVVGARAQ